MIRYMPEDYQDDGRNTAKVVEVTAKGVVRLVRISTNTGKVIKVLTTYTGQDAIEHMQWVWAGKYGNA